MTSFIPHHKVTVGGFWAEHLAKVRDVTLPYQWEALNDRVKGADKSGAVKNFRVAAGRVRGEHQGFVFQDSDLAKWIEAAAYALAARPDAKLERRVDRLIDLICSVQDDDGYLNTAFTLKDRDRRWVDLRDNHELYVSGHMLEAAIAYFEVTGKRKLLDTMLANIDLIDRLFGRTKDRRRGYPGHPEIELALMRLYELTDDPRHLKLASYFIDERGRAPRFFDLEAKRMGKSDFRGLEWYALYNQSNAPIRAQKEAVGHAVRAAYLYAGAADVARATGDRDLFRAVRRLWQNVADRRMYITGGIGSTLLGEAFTFDYDLPNEWAYTETCAAIALVFWSKRMLEHEIDGRYADVIERALYNNILAALSIDGTGCFYRNPLASKPDQKYPKRHARRRWHECACCPPNLSRLLLSVGDYVYSVRKRSLFVHLFVDGKTSFTIGRRAVHLNQRTDYPWDGRVDFEVEPEEPTRFTLGIRIPQWVRTPRLIINGTEVIIGNVTKRGYAQITRTWSPGDRVHLNLPMPVERVYSHTKVRQDAGRVALQKGPVVFCLEGTDNGGNLHEIVLPESATPRSRFVEDELGRHPVITARAVRHSVDTSGRLYANDIEREQSTTEIKAIPYYLWANRGMDEMIVWIRE